MSGRGIPDTYAWLRICRPAFGAVFEWRPLQFPLPLGDLPKSGRRTIYQLSHQACWGSFLSVHTSAEKHLTFHERPLSYGVKGEVSAWTSGNW